MNQMRQWPAPSGGSWRVLGVSASFSLMMGSANQVALAEGILTHLTLEAHREIATARAKAIRVTGIEVLRKVPRHHLSFVLARSRGQAREPLLDAQHLPLGGVPPVGD